MTTRRSLLAYFALPAALTACHPATPAFHPRFAADHPGAELLRLGADLDAAVARYGDAEAALNDAVARFDAIEPPVPEAMILRSSNGWIDTEWPPDALGIQNARRSGNRVCIPSRHDLSCKVASVDGRTVRGRHVRHLKRLSDAYHEAHATARHASGAPTAQEARHDCSRAVSDLNEQIAAITAATPEGLAVKARAELAWSRLWYTESGLRSRPDLIALLENVAALGVGMGGVA